MTSGLTLDWVSPLPPARSGIADYSRDLLPSLSALCDLRVIRLADQPVSEEVERRWRPAPADDLGRDGRLPLYQMGNNRHHREVWRLAHRVPGVLTLHDVALHHLLIELTLAENGPDAYRDRLVADHGWWGGATADARRYLGSRPSALFGLPAHRTLLRRQRGVLVHSRWAERTVGEQDPGVAVRVVPMGVPLADPAGADAAAAWRRARGIPDTARLIGSFGFQTPIKRTDRAIRALANEALAGAHLLIGGERSDGLGLERVAAEAGVGDRVHLLGFLGYEEYELAMGACDLCLNLRYPTAGETSASLLRELALGKPAVVSDYAQFAELPDDVAVRIPLGEGEIEALARAAGELLAAPSRLAAMSAAARRFIAERHAPERAARAVAEACAELAPLDPPGDDAFVAPPPSSLVWHDLSGGLTVEGARLPWRRGEARRLRLTLRNASFARWLSAASDPGGVMIEVQWRPDDSTDPTARQWLELPRELAPDRSLDLEISVRRPLEGAEILMIEPHVKGIGGFNTAGGPTWTLRLE
jgi:glycosyltransferase involved in cell wall biosynthesis